MHDSLRIGLTYKAPFWKKHRTSGIIYSGSGPIQEFYDHSNTNVDRFALSVFLNSNFYDKSNEDRKAEVLQQLVFYYGEIALDYTNYEECVWKNETFTTTENKPLWTKVP
ncbi:MAG: hypothetical protein HKP48_09655 [Winogradskyella sp.]|uniref:hypothetical protein n=1 Tax=Winogradskyella sp. TaxID=1883156 RepID=UPI001838D6F1|nr:hypothetical protein [Winogradskyella sp.]MBT8245660.1 hypothetical protein [Winogradskyella sp.]NNK23533.1 hypothetical protein [Winogradskyella sp.]